MLESRRYYLVYTALYALIAIISYGLLFADGRSFVWSTDGATQHLPALIYLHDWVLDSVSALLRGEFVLSTWDLSIGMGNDMLTALSFYGIGDVLNLLCLLVPREHIGLAYTGIALLRLYLSGIAFSLFARRFELRGYAVLTASLIYAFSGFSLFMVLRHPHFIDPLIYLPLICLGSEKVLDGESPIVFVVSLWLMFCAHFYLSYMVCLLAIGYVACRLAMGRCGSARNAFVSVAKLIGLGVVAACLAAPLLVPNALAVLDSSRTETGGYVPLLYEFSYYVELIPTFSTIGFAGNQCYIGVTQLGVLAIIFLFSQRGRAALVAKAACALLVVSVLVPWAGHAMNGFFYVANRHSFGLVFVASGLVAWLLPRMASATGRQVALLVAGGAVYSVLTVASTVYSIASGEAAGNFGGDGPLLYAARGVLVVALVMATVLALVLASKRRMGESAVKVIACALAIVMVVVDGVAMSAVYRNLMLSFDDVEAVVVEDPLGEAGQDFGRSGGASTSAGELYRLDSGSLEWDDSFAAQPVTRANSGMIDGRFYDTQYFSLTPWSVSDFLSGEMELGGYALSGHHYWEPDGRASLLDLLSVRYWLGDDSQAPYGFEAVREPVLENAGAVPFGFTYSQVIDRDSYEQLAALDRQETLMSTCAIEDAQEAIQAGLTHAVPESEAKVMDVDVVTEGSVNVRDDGACGVEVAGGSQDAHMTLTFDAVRDAELYAELVDFSPSYGAQGSVTVRAVSGDDRAWCRFVPPGEQAYSAYNSGLLFLGYSNRDRSQVTLTLPARRFGYGFSAVRIWALPMDSHQARAATLSRDHLEEVRLHPNRISGKIELNDPKLMCLSIPFSPGWRIQVDGEDTELMRVNTSMCGVLLAPGNHDVELRYETPGLSAGIALFFVGVVALVALSVFRMIRCARGDAAC